MWNWDDHFDALEAEKAKAKDAPSLEALHHDEELVWRAQGRCMPAVPEASAHPDWAFMQSWAMTQTKLHWDEASLAAYPALMRRRGSTLKTLWRDPDAARLVAMAWCLGQSTVSPMDADQYLETQGDWLNVSRADLWALSVAMGSIDPSGAVLIDSVERASVRAFRDACEAFREEEARRQATQKAWREAKNKADNPKPVFGSLEVTPEDEQWMKLALEEARLAAQESEIPVGAILVMDEECLVKTHNRTVASGAPMQHAECLAIQEAVRQFPQKCPGGKLNRATLYVTLEPCPLCAGAIWESRVGRVVYGASDPKMGAMGGAMNLFDVKTLNHHPTVVSGVGSEAARALLIDFFQSLRQSK